MDAISVYVVAADEAEADRIADALVAEHLAACVNILGPIRSVYRWQGAVERACEIALIAKSRAALFDRVAACIRTHHSYEIPAIVAGDTGYLEWIAAETAPV